MELIARLDGLEREVRVEREGEHWRVAIGDRVYEVDAAAFGDAGRSLLIAGEQHEVVVRSAGNGRYQVASTRGVVDVEVVDPLTHLARHAGADAAATGTRQTTAYMPGRVVTRLVAEGDSVEAGQGVLVLEAMKMENEIRAESAGVVRRFFVAEGEAVESGDALFEVE